MKLQLLAPTKSDIPTTSEQAGDVANNLSDTAATSQPDEAEKNKSKKKKETKKG